MTDAIEYSTRLFATEDALLRELREEIGRRGMPQISVPPLDGKLLQVLIAANGARRILEIGTLGGYSAIVMARAMPPEGRILTLEIEPAHAEVARDFFARAGVARSIEVRVGPAAAALAELCDRGERFDACFIDADKENYPHYLEHALELVRPGGMILAHNALWSGRVLDENTTDAATRALQAFNRRLADDPRLLSVLIPVGDGIAVAVVRNGAGQPS